jgi:uncharacterized protein (TIGR02677 family)
VGRSGRESRIEQLSREAVAAIRTLTLNLTRLSRAGVAASSRRADFVRLAQFFRDADSDEAAALAVAAFGLQPTNHYGVLADDAGDPVSPATSWWRAPRAPVPLSLRERGDTTNRGRATPIADRRQAQELLRLRRREEAEALRRVDRELLDGPLEGRQLSTPAFARFRHLVGRTLHHLDTRATDHERADGEVSCRVVRAPGRHTAITSPEGILTLHDLVVTVHPTLSAQEADGRVA